jgi:hypothetical protein
MKSWQKHKDLSSLEKLERIELVLILWTGYLIFAVSPESRKQAVAAGLEPW